MIVIYKLSLSQHAFIAIQTQVNEQIADDAANIKAKNVPGTPPSPTLKSV